MSRGLLARNTLNLLTERWWHRRWPSLNSIDSAAPASTDSPSLGDDQIRAFKLAVQDFLGITDATSYTAGAVTYQTNGRWTALTRWSLREGAAIASAAALTPGTDGNLFHITGTTGMTSIASIDGAGPLIFIYDDVVTITHNATSLIMLGGVNVTTAAGMVIAFMHEGSGNYREIFRGIGFDSTNPAAIGTAAPGTANTAARRDHVHAHGDGGSAAVHGLGASVNVLGNRSASGEFVQRSTLNPSAVGVLDNPVYKSNDAVTFAVAFSSTPYVMPAGTTDNNGDMIGSQAVNISTTSFNFQTINIMSGSNFADARWVALGA